MRLKASKILRNLQEDADWLTVTETKQGIHFSSGGRRVRDTAHCMKAVSDKTRFYLFLLHTFLSSLIFSLQVDLTQRLFFFSCSNPSPPQSLSTNTTGRMAVQLFFALALRHRLHFSGPGFSLALWSSSLRRHDSSLAPHSAMCRENYLFSCCNSLKAKMSWDSTAALGSPCSYILQQQLALV